jgi:multiple sugar transport system substrate-binding protein
VNRLSRRHLARSSALLAAAPLAACGTGAGSAPSTSAASAAPRGKAIYLSHQTGGIQVDQYRQLADRFAQRYPGAEVEIVPTPQGEGHQVKLQAMIAAGTAPETTFLADWDLIGFVERSLVDSVDERAARDKFDLRAFFPATLDLCRWTVAGAAKLWALPRHPSPQALFYSPERFAARGLTAPDASWTWDTWLETAKKLSGAGQWGALSPYTIPHQAFPVVRSMGGDVLDKAGRKFTLHEAAATAAIQWIADISLRHLAAPPAAEVRGTADGAQFANGQAAMSLGIYPFIGAVYSQGKGTVSFDVAPLPKGPKGRVNRNVAGTYPMVKGSANPDVGWAWLKFLSTKETQLFLAADGTVFPSLREAARAPELMTPPAPSPRVNRKVFVDAVEHDVQVGEPRHRAYNDVTRLVTTTLVPVWDGTRDARSALQAIAGQVDALLAGT